MTNFIEVDDLDRREVQIYAETSERQLLRYLEPEPGIFIAESPKVIRRALDAGYRPISVLAEKGAAQKENEVVALCGNVPVYTANADVLWRITGYHLTQGILCAMQRKKLPKAEEICGHARRIAVLEEIVNPTNIGAIFRCAAALNMDAVLLTGGCSDPLYRRAIRVSMGTVFQIPWTYLQHTEDGYVRELQQMGFSTAALALRDDCISVEDPRLAGREKLAVLLGTEGEGLRDETIRACDYTVKIPMANGVDSLNVAAASAIAFWQLRR